MKGIYDREWKALKEKGNYDKGKWHYERENWKYYRIKEKFYCEKECETMKGKVKLKKLKVYYSMLHAPFAGKLCWRW